VITCDCGTTDHEAIAWLRDRGVGTIVIDHHQVPDSMPPTNALVNPHQPACAFPFKGMCSAGVSFYLCAALRTAVAGSIRGPAPDPRAWLDLVALATVCDMVPLVLENHVLVRHGLRVMQERRRPGLRALLAQAGIEGREPVHEEDLSFRLGPRLNAPGRLGPARPALTLLRARSDAEARALALELEASNERRRHEQSRMLAEAHGLLERDPALARRASVVVAREGWPPGIVGIAAAGLADHYRRPALVLAVDRQSGEARGSARSFGDVDVLEALRACAGLVTRFGGHRQAAGVSLALEHTEALCEAFDRAVAEQQAERGRDDVAFVDGTLDLANVNEALVAGIEAIGPFGPGFAPPRYLVEDTSTESVRVLKGEHLALVLRQGPVSVEAIAFRQADVGVEPGDRVACLVRPRFNHFRGRRRIQLHIERLWRT
jgi:single-stranded-DNA-specific exonuclease